MKRGNGCKPGRDRQGHTVTQRGDERGESARNPSAQIESAEIAGADVTVMRKKNRRLLQTCY